MTYVIGIDPGPVTGIVGLWTQGPGLPLDVVQCSDRAVTRVLAGLTVDMNNFAVRVATESFVLGPRAARSNDPAAGRSARYVLDVVQVWSREFACAYVGRNAAQVKPWAGDARLIAAGLFAPTKGMRHARDAARHALYAAVKDCGMRDPLSKRGAIT